MNKTVNILLIKQYNSSCTRDTILKYPLLDPSAIVPGDLANLTLSHLLVSGVENLPNGQPHNWNRIKSLRLLRLVNDEAESDSDNDANDNPIAENSVRSRNRRLKLAKALGISQTQLNFAQLSL